MDAERDRRLTIGIGLFLALLILSAGLMYGSTRQLKEAAVGAAHTEEVVDALADLSASLGEAESGQLASVITGHERYVAPRAFLLVALNQKVERVRELTENNARQQERFRLLRDSLSNQLRVLSRLATAKKGAGADGSRYITLTDEWQRAADATRSLVRELAQEEEELLQELEQSSQRAYLSALASGFLTTLLAVLAVGAAIGQRQRHRTARALAASHAHGQQELLQAVLSRSGAGVIATDAEGAVTLLNPTAQALTGWTPEEAHSKHLDVIFRIVHPETRRAVDNSALGALRWGRLVQRTDPALLIARDGRECLIEDSAVPLRREDGKARGALLVFRELRARIQDSLPEPGMHTETIRRKD